MTGVDDLIAFVTARLDEDEAAARAAAEDNEADWFANAQEGWDPDERSVMYTGPSTLRPGDTWDYPVCRSLEVSAAGHIARHDPARVLREVEAKRAAIAMHDEFWRLYRSFEQAGEPGPISLGRAQGLSRVVRHIAAVYSDHPDYRPEWKP